MLKIVFLFIFLFKANAIEFTDLRFFGERVRNLSLELFYFTEIENEGDVVMAPFTIWNLISLFAFKTSSGSWRQLHSIIGIPKRNGEYFNSLFKYTTGGMTNKIHYPGASFKNKQVIFCDTSLELTPSFQKSLNNSGALLKMIDFEDNNAAAEEANDYIQSNNNFLNPNRLMFDRTDFKEPALIMSSVIEFEGNWTIPFDESDTILDGDVYIMQQKAIINQVYIEALGATVMDLIYGKSKDFTMVIIKPQGNTSLIDILINFNKITFADVLYELYSKPPREVEVKLPKFSLTSSLSLSGPLTSMEARDIFLSNEADFSGMTDEDIYISAMEYRTVITVTEKGTLASACTPAKLAESPATSITDTDSPFLFFLVYRPSFTILFCGKYGA